jgi:hypothetical protein
MVDQMRMRGRQLQTPIYGYLHPDSGRRVWLAGMIHEGEPGYFADITTTVAAFIADGAVVHAECTAVPPQDLASATPQERDIAQLQDRLSELSAAFAGHPACTAERFSCTP